MQEQGDAPALRAGIVLSGRGGHQPSEQELLYQGTHNIYIQRLRFRLKGKYQIDPGIKTALDQIVQPAGLVFHVCRIVRPTEMLLDEFFALADVKERIVRVDDLAIVESDRTFKFLGDRVAVKDISKEGL